MFSKCDIQLKLMDNVILFASVAMSAQGSHAFEKGYRDNVSLTGNVGVDYRKMSSKLLFSYA